MIRLLQEEDAVSPVIGVVLMVAITVVLAATVATFVVGFDDRINDTAPSAGFSTKYTSDPDASTDSWGHDFTTDFDGDSVTEDGALSVEFTGGDAIDADALSMSFPGGSLEFAGAGSQPYSSGSEVGAGDDVTLAVAPGDTVRVVWTAEAGDRTATLTEEEVPD